MVDHHLSLFFPKVAGTDENHYVKRQLLSVLVEEQQVARLGLRKVAADQPRVELPQRFRVGKVTQLSAAQRKAWVHGFSRKRTQRGQLRQ